MTGEDLRQSVNEVLTALGLETFGVADVSGMKHAFLGFGEGALEGLDRGVCAAVRLSDAILEEIVDRPTPLYFHHYRTANMRLDQAAMRLSERISALGYRALPVPASQILDWETQRGQVSHKHVAVQAGLGWIGRNNLLVTPEHGSRIRLVTVLTDMPLEPDRPMDADCGTCRDCITVCPAGAIKETQAAFDHMACFEKLREFRKGNIGQYICGVCVKACRGKTRSKG